MVFVIVKEQSICTNCKCKKQKMANVTWTCYTPSLLRLLSESHSPVLQMCWELPCGSKPSCCITTRDNQGMNPDPEFVVSGFSASPYASQRTLSATFICSCISSSTLDVTIPPSLSFWYSNMHVHTIMKSYNNSDKPKDQISDPCYADWKSHRMLKI